MVAENRDYDICLRTIGGKYRRDISLGEYNNILSNLPDIVDKLNFAIAANQKGREFNLDLVEGKEKYERQITMDGMRIRELPLTHEYDYLYEQGEVRF